MLLCGRCLFSAVLNACRVCRLLLAVVQEKCGAIEACVEESADMVESAWQRLDKVIPDSFYKMLLRSFGWYVLQRHY
jgi:hypothetical protein